MAIISVDDAMTNAKAAAGELITSRLKVALKSAQAKTARLVQRIDRDDAFYYIVTFMIGEKESARMIIGGADGKLRQVSGISEQGAALRSYLPAADAMKRLMTDWEKVLKPKFRLRDGNVGQHPVLVWKPSFQSSSPFLPFHQFSVGNSFVYVRVDGKLFDAVTSGPA